MYFPMLRWKQGEEIAMSKAPANWLGRVTPIWMFEERKDYLTEYGGIKNVWSGNFILDVSTDDIGGVNAQLVRVLTDPLAFIAASLDQLPLMSAQLLQVFSSKPVIRISVPDFTTAMNPDFHGAMVSQLAQCPFRNVTLILDFHEVTDDHLNNTAQIASFCSSYAVGNVASIIISSGVFPKMLDGVLGRHLVQRKDKEFYQAMLRLTSISFLFSDYATIHPWWRQSNTMRSGHTNLKYTHDDYWLVLRDQGRGGDVSRALARLLVASPEYRGPLFSWADKVWHERAANPPLAGPGNAAMHVSESVHHHIEQVLQYG